ncbi:MAG: hypothetical protein ACR2QO_28785 [Acidimicrobiales bacterium]
MSEDREAPNPANDELLARLADADPIDPTTLPTSTAPAAQKLLEEIMTNGHQLTGPDSNTDPSPNTDPHPDHGAEVLDLPEVDGIDRYAAPRRQRLGVIAAIAAVFIAIVGFVVVSPNGTEPALASVQSAARATAEIESGRATTTFELEATDGDRSEMLSGEVQTEFSGTNVAASFSLDELAGELAEGNANFLPESVDVRLVDGVLYGYDGEQWFAVETGGTLGQSVVERVDPRSVLETVQDLVETTEVGAADIDGVETTHYQSVVDLADESLQESGWLPFDAADIEADGEMTIDLYVDADGLLRQLVVSGDAAATDGSNGSGTVLITSTFSDFGADITIEAPEAAEFLDPGMADFDFEDELEDELDLDDSLDD